MAPDCIGPKCPALAAGEMLLLENLRFHPEEEKNEPEFARQLAPAWMFTSMTPSVPPTARMLNGRDDPVCTARGSRAADGEGARVPHQGDEESPSTRAWRSSAAPKFRTRSRSSKTF